MKEDRCLQALDKLRENEEAGMDESGAADILTPADVASLKRYVQSQLFSFYGSELHIRENRCRYLHKCQDGVEALGEIVKKNEEDLRIIERIVNGAM